MILRARRIIFAFIMSLTICIKTDRNMPFKQISPSEAKEILSTEPALLVDIRDDESYNESHINGSFHLTQANLHSFLQNTDKNTPILVICYHGNSSQMVAEYLSGEGFSDVYSIMGGYEAWHSL